MTASDGESTDLYSSANAPADLVQRREGPRYLLLVSILVVSFLIGGTGATIVSLILQPLIIELNWSSRLASTTATVFNIVTLMSAPAVGAVVDRMGLRGVLSAGVVLFALGLAAISYCHTPAAMFVAFAVTGLGYCASFAVPTSVAVALAFPSRRNLGMGLLMAATSVGAALSAVALSYAFGKDGWRVSLLYLASLTALLIPLVWVGTASAGRQPRVGGGISTAPTAKPDAREALRSPAFFFVTSVTILFNVALAAIYYHVISIIAAAGYSQSLAGQLLGLTWILSGVGSFCFGAWAERAGVRFILTLELVMGSLGILCLLGTTNGSIGAWFLGAFVLLWGATANCTSQLIPVILSERFGVSWLGTLLGVATAIAGLVSAAAPVATGYLYDRYQQYTAAIVLSAMCGFFAAALVPFAQKTRATGVRRLA